MNTYILSSEITAGNVQFKELQNITIISSLEELTDTAVFSVPRNAKLKGKLIADYLKVGDKVLIKLGYNDTFKIEFEGYITKIKPEIPLTIECEDEMWNLKKAIPNKAFANATLKDIVTYIAPQYKVNYLDENFKLGKFTIQNTTPAKVLESLKEFGLYSYFRSGELNITLLSGFQTHANSFVYNKYNIKSAENLSVITKEELKFKVRAISNNSDGEKSSIELGDDDGDLRTFNYLDKKESELKELAKKELENLKKDRASGSITGFGFPQTKAGDFLTIENNSKTDVTGKFLIHKTTVQLGSSGFQRTNELGIQLQ